MAVTLSLLRVMSKAVLNVLGGGFAGELLCELLPEVAKKAWDDWSKEKSELQRLAEVEHLANASDEDVRHWVKDAVAEAAGDQTEEVRQQLAGYLQQFPAAIRQNLRRPTDPTGTTVPAGLPLRRASDLLALLPKRPPRFRPGDRPLTGVDLELVELLGVGGFGEVWKARNPHRPRAAPVALKFCLDASAAKALRNEVDVLDRVMSAGRHPGIVPLLHTYLSADPPCLELEYVEGGDLAGLIREWHLTGPRPTPLQAMKVVRHLAEAVAFGHQQDPPIVHRDLKPANVLVNRDADGKLHHRVSDFGLGALAHADLQRTQRTTGVQGGYTPLYASPEQIKGERPATTDDVYALGVLWYQLLTGDLDRGAPTGLGWVRELKQLGMSEVQIELLGACVAPHAVDRPPSAVTLLERLDEVMRRTDPPVLAVPVPQEKPARKPAGRVEEGSERPRKVPVGLIVFFGVLGFLALALVLTIPIIAVATRDRKPPPGRTSPRPGPEVVNGLGMKLVRIKPGQFLMGSPEGEADRDESEGPQQEVEITRAFYLGAHEVTQEEYTALMGKLPDPFNPKPEGDEARLPVGGVSRKDAQTFCDRLSERPEEKKAGRRYRLPTEAEWEYACRAGTTTPFSCGNNLTGGEANFNTEKPYPAWAVSLMKPQGKPQPVGSYPANAWGLFDMHGNLREWVADALAPYDPSRSRVNPFVPLQDGKGTVLRGGSYQDSGNQCRSAYRFQSDLNTGNERYGFRVAMDWSPRSPEPGREQDE